MAKVHTLQFGNKLLILDGKSPLRYVDLSSNTLHVYKPKAKPFSLFYKVEAK